MIDIEQLEQRVGEAWEKMNLPDATVEDVQAYREAHDALIRARARDAVGVVVSEENRRCWLLSIFNG